MSAASLSLVLALAATSLMIVTAVAVLDAMRIARCGIGMWAAWLSIALTAALSALNMLSTGIAPPLAGSMVMLTMAWQIWSLRRRIIWRAHHGHGHRSRGDCAPPR